MNQPQEYLDNLRHSAAHLLAKAVLELYPGAHNAIGPSIENGFYQDFDLGKSKISEADLPNIEKKMREILPTWKHFEFKEVTVQEARKLFKHNSYKVELAEEFAKGGKKLMTNDPGNFLDLCKMGHVDNPSKELQNFKLLSVAGAYWRGSEKNPMLTRIYGTAWPTKKELDDYLKMREEAEKRDHKKLGPKLDLFTFSELVGAGLPLFTPKGTLIRDLLDNFVWSLRQKYGYQKVDIPHITKKDLYLKSGHWDKFKNELYKINTREGHEFAIKPMNCPHHIQIFARKKWSYRELPQRYASTTKIYRDEQTGELSGLARVRSITQDDAHVFCRMAQSEDELLYIWEVVHDFYGVFNLPLKLRLSLHDPKHPEKYLGDKALWKDAENILRAVAKAKKVQYFEAIGEAAFYGPKLDFMATDSLKREWQVATIQLDLNMPKQFGLTCTNEDGEQSQIVMIHAAIMGAIERFLSVLIEHFAGAFPVWLSPVQVAVLPISDKQVKYSQKIVDELQKNSIRVDFYNRAESIGKKIREAELQKIPYMLIVGEKEVKAKSVSVRARNQKDLGKAKLDKFIERVLKEIKNKKI